MLFLRQPQENLNQAFHRLLNERLERARTPEAQAAWLSLAKQMRTRIHELSHQYPYPQPQYFDELWHEISAWPYLSETGEGLETLKTDFQIVRARIFKGQMAVSSIEDLHLDQYKAQYEALPKGNILAKDSTWETVQARLSDPINADMLRKVQEKLQGGGRLYAVMEDGSLEFVDGNPDTPPMFVKNKKTGEFQIIYKRDAEEMAAACAQIDAETHEWASVQEMLDWAKANGFDVFEADANDKHWFGKEMQLAEASSPTGHFVGKSGGPWMATTLKDARYAVFYPVYGYVYVNIPYPTYRDAGLGLLRRLRI